MVLWELTVKYKSALILGLKVTMFVTVMSLLLGLVLGVVLAIMKTRKLALLRWIAMVYVEIVRGTPVMLQLVIVFYMPAAFGVNYPKYAMFDGSVYSDRFIAAVLALGLNCAAMVCEIVRGGILSVDRGQSEAALSLGMGEAMAIREIILPQAMINILPSLGNEFVNMIKTTSMVTIIGLADLMYASNLIRGQSYRPFEPFVIVGIIYFILTFSFSNLFKYIEKKSTKSRRAVTVGK